MKMILQIYYISYFKIWFSRCGRINVGGFAMGSVAETKTSDIGKQYKLNFETAYNVARPVFVQMMKQNSGRIFIIGSKPGLSSVNSKGMVAYGLAKSLIFRLAELMNAEAKGTNVVTSCYCTKHDRHTTKS
jgi:short-subunit dehydrogenase